jgi:hypothetical protein
MSGVAAVRSLLAGSTTLVAQVPVTRILAGTIPMGAQVPAIGITKVDAVPRLTVAGGTPQFVTERVQVTAIAATYKEAKELLELVRQALPYSRGSINGVAVDSILPDVEGPDFEDIEVGVFMNSQDFIVRFTR